MIDKPHLMNNIHASVLIGAGVASYFLNENRPKTALIPPAVGASLLTMTPGLKTGNQQVAHAAVGVTALLSVMTGKLLTQALLPNAETRQKFDPSVLNRRATVFGLMTLSGVAALGVYVAGFVAKRKAKAGAV
ncbi:hypothetical protein ACMA1I_10210 [Pontibacter sp. 13R65]|uniref:hypothetical protein n=1 Tax=Pontibacter sp. 13R65 TaxID=3127458 RepID=UPI00301D19B7